MAKKLKQLGYRDVMKVLKASGSEAALHYAKEWVAKPILGEYDKGVKKGCKEWLDEREKS